MFFYLWKVHRMPFYINGFWTKHISGGGLGCWYTDVASLGSCPWPWETFQVYWQQLTVVSPPSELPKLGDVVRKALLKVAQEKKIVGGQIWRTRRRNARCVATGDPPFLINSSTIKAQCSPDHAMVYTENGTYTAVRRRAPHHCTRSPSEAMPLPNRGVLSAAPCIIWWSAVKNCDQLWKTAISFGKLRSALENCDQPWKTAMSCEKLRSAVPRWCPAVACYE